MMDNDYKVIILATHNREDFPNKVMADIHGKPMVQHVYESAIESGASEVIIATDNTRTGMAAEEFGATVCMIVEQDLTMIEQMREVVEKMGWRDETIVVNLPVDAPLTPGLIIRQVADNLIDNDEADCTILYSLASPAVAEDERSTKLVLDHNHYVMYCSHRLIPYQYADMPVITHYKCHLEINAYRAGLIRIYSKLVANEVDQVEDIDELKLLYNGLKIHAEEANSLIGHRVFSQEDIEKVKLQIAPGK